MRFAVDRTDTEESRAGVPGPLVAIVAGSLTGGVLGLLFAMGNDAENLSPAFAFGAIIGLLVATLGVDQWVGSRRYRLAQAVPLDRYLVQVHAARWFGGPPWILSRQQPGELV